MSGGANRAVLAELIRRRARTDLLTFLRWCWWDARPFKVGRHTRGICDRLTRAMLDWREGKSTRLVISVPFRHGKSEIAKGFAAWFLGCCADKEPLCIEACYNKDLAVSFSKKIRAIIQSEQYQALFPTVALQRGSNRNDMWGLANSSSTFRATGLINGSSTGFGANLIIVDDYLKGYRESRSQTTKKAILNAFKSDLFTRQNSGGCIILVIATQWASDDLIGSIENSGDFPGFEFLRYPARKAGPDGWATLFPEVYDDEWYTMERKALGPRVAAALLDCAPIPDGGGRFKPAAVNLHTTLDGWPKVREVRAWDLASSAKQRDSDDPDWTWGVRLGVTGSAKAGWDIWVRNAVCVRDEAPGRNALIQRTARADGPAVPQYVEAFGAYKDAAAELKQALSGVALVRPIRMPGDKSVKAAPMEPSWDAPAEGGKNRVHVYTGLGGMTPDVWERWALDFGTFPDGKHDDAVDATGLAFHALTSASESRMLI